MGDSSLSERLVESAPDAFVVADPLGRIVLVNAQTEKLFGYARGELLGKLVEVLMPGHLRARHEKHRAGYSQAPKARSMGSGLDLWGMRKDGTEFPIEISLSPLETDDGILTASAIRDISERKRIEAAARLASERLLGAVESMQGLFALYDDRDRLVLCNSAYRELFGSALEGPIVARLHAEVIDAGIAAGLVGASPQTTEAFRGQWLEYHTRPVGTFDVRTPDERTLRVTDRRTLEGGTISTIWDITDDVAHETELKEAHALAEAASKAKTEFLASMSHEIRTPLNSILGFAQLLQRDKKTPPTERQLEKLDHVLKGGQHLLRLIDDILDLSRIEAGGITVSPEPVEVVELLTEVKATLESMASRMSIELAIIAPASGNTMRVVADRVRLSQILMNFGSNAIKYGRKGGRATFAFCRGSDAIIRISVSDDGNGIAPDKQDKIFQPFQRAGQETGPIEGTGIGLTIAKRLAQLMGGSVEFRSVLGEGSEFWIDLPRHFMEATADERAESVTLEGPAALVGGQGRQFTVVYIEDNPSNIAFMQALISELERVILVTAPTAELGIELVRDRLPDAVIMDINLPGMSGYEATRKLRALPETAHIPVIALTAAATARDQKRALDAGFFRYLTKPVKVDEFIQALEELFS